MEKKIAQRVRAQRWFLRYPRGILVTIFFLSTTSTALSVFAIERVETQRSIARHLQMAQIMQAAIERLANANAIYLRAGASLISLRKGLSPAEFRAFSRQLNLDQTLGSGGATAFGQLVTKAEVPMLESQIRRGGQAAFTVHPGATAGSKAKRPDVLPVIIVEPDTAATHPAIGFDMFSEPVRRAAIERTLRSGQPAASGAIQLIVDQPAPHHTGFAIFMRIDLRSPDGRPVRGVIGRAFNAGKFLDTALAREQPADYGVALFDAEAARPILLAQRGPLVKPAHRIVQTFRFIDHRMRLEVSPARHSALSNLSMLALLFGTLVTLLLMIVAKLVTDHAAEDRAALGWFEEQASVRKSLTRELNHRVKNTLANVLSIIALTHRRSTNLDDFVEALNGRIRALSATHDLLTQSEWGATAIRALIDAELAPYAQDVDAVVTMRGQHVALAPNDALSLGMAVHELATNATKYGALSAPGGRVEIEWQMITDKLVRVKWSEHGGPPVSDYRRRGFGTELIEKIVAHELGNPVDLHFAPDGVRCNLIVPVRPPAAFQIRALAESEGASGAD